MSQVPHGKSHAMGVLRFGIENLELLRNEMKEHKIVQNSIRFVMDDVKFESAEDADDAQNAIGALIKADAWDDSDKVFSVTKLSNSTAEERHPMLAPLNVLLDAGYVIACPTAA